MSRIIRGLFLWGLLSLLSCSGGGEPTSPQHPDLQILDVSFHPAVPSAGDTVTVSAVVTNLGKAPAAASVTRVTFDSAAVKVADLPTPALAVGARDTVLYRDPDVSAGSHQVEVCADTRNDVDESNEGNNCITRTLGAVRRPDLRVAELYRAPEHPAATEDFTLLGVIENAGLADAPANLARFRLDRDAYLVNVPPLAAGARVTVSYNSVPRSEGTHKIELCVDWNRTVDESNEDNNCREDSVVVGGLPPLPNLVVRRIYFLPSQPTQGVPFEIHAVIINQGEIPADTCRSRFLLNGSDDPCGELPTAALNPGDSTEVVCQSRARSRGSYSLVGCVDATRIVVESDEGDNCLNDTLVVLPPRMGP